MPRRTRHHRKARAAVANAACQMLALENRQLMAVQLGADGYTTFIPSSDSLIVHVSSSGGNDNNDGSIGSPVKTLAKAKSMVRDGKPDQILLKRDDVWNEVFGSWTKSGRDDDEPIVIGSYGTGANRPWVRTNGLDADGISLSGGTTVAIHDLAIQGIRFTDNTHAGTEDRYGIRLQRTGARFHIEDVYIDNFKDGIVIGMEPPNAGVSNITIRRSVIVDQWQKSGHSQGIYASGSTNGLVIEENVLDHNGWKEGVAGAEKTVFNHNIYINNGAQGVVIRDNISTRASLRGVLSRGGGIITGNLTARNAIGIETWGDSTISGNVVLENGDVPNFPQGFGIQVTRNNGDTIISDNIVAHDWSNYTYNVFGIKVWHSLNSAIVRNNIVYDWRRPFFFDSSGGIGSMDVYNNQFQTDDNFHAVVAHDGPTNANDVSYHDNKYWSTRTQPFWLGTGYTSTNSWMGHWPDNSTFGRQNYLDPNRELGHYNSFIGGANSFDAFINNARGMSRASYNPNYTAAPVIAFIRQGFNLGAGVGTLVSVTATDATAAEPTGGNPADPGSFTLFRTGPVTSALTINYSITGTASYGVDYTTGIPQTGSITFPAGSSSVVVNFTPLTDGTAEDPETVQFRVLSGAGYDPGTPADASVNIADGNGGTIPPDYGGGSGGGIIGPGGGFIPYPYDPVTGGTGLRGDYYDDSGFVNFVVDRLDPNPVQYNFGAGAPNGVPLSPDTYSVRWTGFILPNGGSQVYQFRIAADDGVRLYVDDQLVIDTLTPGQFGGDANGDGFIDIDDFGILAANFNQQPRTFEEGDFNGDQKVDIDDFGLLASRFNTPVPPLPSGADTGSIFLEGSFRTPIVLEYVERTGDANVTLYWTKPGEPDEEIVPMGVLFPPDGYTGTGTGGRAGGGSASTLVAADPPAPVRASFSQSRIGSDSFYSDNEDLLAVLPA